MKTVYERRPGQGNVARNGMTPKSIVLPPTRVHHVPYASQAKAIRPSVKEIEARRMRSNEVMKGIFTVILGTIFLWLMMCFATYGG